MNIKSLSVIAHIGKKCKVLPILISRLFVSNSAKLTATSGAKKPFTNFGLIIRSTFVALLFFCCVNSSYAIQTATPTATGGAVCVSGTVTLTANDAGTAGGTYKWYSAAAGGTLLQSSTSNTFTTPVITTTTNYWVTYTQGGRTESNRFQVTATVGAEISLSTMPTTGAYLSYPFSGNANDVSSAGNNGTVRGGATLTTDRYGNANSAYNFVNGSAEYISTSVSTASPGPTNFSISVWFKTTTGGGMLVGFGSSQTGASTMYDRHIYMSDGGQIYYGIYPNLVQTINTTASYADGNWHNAVATTSTTTGSNLYVDGALQATDVTMTTCQVYAGWWRVGYDNLGLWTNEPTNYYFNGSLDDIAVYKSTLTAAQVYTEYGAGSAPICVGGTLALQSNAVAGATYAWSGPNGFTSTSQNPTVSTNATAAMAGTYTCTVTNAGGCSYTTNVTGVVTALPSASFTATSAVNTGGTATINYTGTDPATSTYAWTFPGGTPATGTGQGPFSVTWSTTGTKTISLTVTNSTGCSSTSTQTVTVTSPFSTYAFSKPITLNTSATGIGTTLTNFPALVYIQDNDLEIGSACANLVQYPTGGATGYNYDFAFTLVGSSTELNYQVDSYDQVTGKLLVWVQIPTVTSTNTNLVFYFGSKSPSHTAATAAATWATDYQAVYHFDEGSTSVPVLDATSNAKNATQTLTTIADDEIHTAAGLPGDGGGYIFNGTNSEIKTTASEDIINSSFTLSAWIKIASYSISDDQKIVTNETSYTTGGYKLSVYSDGVTAERAELETRASDGTLYIDRTVTGGSAISTGTWYYIQGVYDKAAGRFITYRNGAVDRSTTTNVGAAASGGVLHIGSDFAAANWFNGEMDEVRISNVAKSADWIKAEYYNQTNPLTFTNYSAAVATNQTNAAAIAGALTYTWTGTTSADPTVAANWNNTTAGTVNQLPAFDGTATLVIPAGLTNYPSLTANESLYGLTIASGASLNLNGFTLSVGCNIYNSSGGQILYGNALASGITWNGAASTQTYTGSGAANTAQLGNMTVNNSLAGTITLSGGPVDIYNTLTLTKGNLVISSSPAALTLKSTATQTASVAAIPAAYSITGVVTAERFVTGGNTFSGGRWIYRNYRLMSSPVNEGASSGKYPFSLNYLGASTIITGCTSSYATYGGNPSLYLYNEGYTPSNSTFTSGNFIGVTNINNTLASGHISTTDATNATGNVYVGDGFMMYFRGDNINNLTGSPSKTSAPYVAPENVTFSTTGNLNQGTYSVVSWTGTAGLMYTTSNAGNASVRGFNLVGNPYPSSIDWSKFSNSNPGAAIYGLNVNPTIYILNPITSNFDTYNATTGISTGIPPGTARNIIPSGQGFFVQANNNTAASPTLTFTESAKTSTQVSGGNLLLGTPDAQSAYNSYLRLKLVTDTINNDDIVIGFNSTSATTFNGNEDSQFMPGPSSPQSIAALSSDRVSTSVKWVPLPKSALNQVIRLNATARATGTYTLLRTDFKAIPQLYQVWLMDNYKKDSLDIRNNTTYAFDINLTDTASYGSNRFSVVVREDPALMVHLLNFTASKITSGSQVVWVTENEANYTNFTVERSIDGGKTYTILGGVDSNDLGTYSYLDRSPVNGANLYRLQIVDLNGTITYSNIVTLMYGSTATLVKTGIVVYPNPATTILNLAIAPGFNSDSGSTGTGYEIQIANILGAVVLKTTTHQQSFQADVSGLMPGTYIINVINTKDNSSLGQATFIKL